MAQAVQGRSLIVTLQVPAEYDDDAYLHEVFQHETSHHNHLLKTNLSEYIQDLGVMSTDTMPTTCQLQLTSSRESDKTNVSVHVRTASSTSKNSTSTSLTSQSSNEQLSSEILEEEYTVRRKKEIMARMSISPSSQEKLTELRNIGLPPTESCQIKPQSPTLTHRRSYRRIRDRLRFKTSKPKSVPLRQEPIICCVRCRKSHDNSTSIYSLPCCHGYCKGCLQTLIMQASEDLTNMPPQCCSLLIPGSIIDDTLKESERIKFLRCVLQLRTQLESQVLCPNIKCSGVINEFYAINSPFPLELGCPKCDVRICSSCKCSSHPIGMECPSAWARDTTSHLSDKKLQRSLTNKEPCEENPCKISNREETQTPCLSTPDIETSESTCSINDAHHNEDNKNQILPRITSTEEIEKNLAAAKRTAESVELSTLRALQVNERDRFRAFERKMKWYMATRHSRERIAAQEKFENRVCKLKERHAKATSNLEDIQVAAELEMISSFEVIEKNIRTRLRHMEAYCESVGRQSEDPSLERVVTENDLRQLGQQYNLRDNMHHIHQSKIKVLRDKQAKQTEKLMLQQERELNAMLNKREELTVAEQRFQKEKSGLTDLFSKRKATLLQKWLREEAAERQRLTEKFSVEYAPITPPIEWPDPDSET